MEHSLLHSFVAAQRKVEEGRGGGRCARFTTESNRVKSRLYSSASVEDSRRVRRRHDRYCPTVNVQDRGRIPISITNHQYTFLTRLGRREVRLNHEESLRNSHTRELFRDREAALAAMMGVSGE